MWVIPVVDLGDASIDQNLRTLWAWGCGGIEHCVPGRESVERCLNDGVLFGMNADTLLLSLTLFESAVVSIVTAHAPAIIAVSNAVRCSIITSRNDTPVLHKNRTNVSPDTVGSRRNYICERHKIGIPVWSLLCIHIVVEYTTTMFG